MRRPLLVADAVWIIAASLVLSALTWFLPVLIDLFATAKELKP